MASTGLWFFTSPKQPLHLRRLDRGAKFVGTTIFPSRLFLDGPFRPNVSFKGSGSGLSVCGPPRVVMCCANKPEELGEPAEKKPPRLATCLVCLARKGKRFEKISYLHKFALKKHYKDHHSKLWSNNISCNFCGNFFMTKRLLENHIPNCQMRIQAMFAAVQGECGWEIIQVFETSLASTTHNKQADKNLETKEIQDAENATLMTEAVIELQFPDNHTLVARFDQSDVVGNLYDLVKKVVTDPKLPFKLYSTRPKKQLEDMSLSFKSAGFAPGAIVCFAYDTPKGYDCAPVAGPILKANVMALKGLEYVA